MKAFLKLPKLPSEFGYFMESQALGDGESDWGLSEEADEMSLDALTSAWVEPTEVADFAQIAEKIDLAGVRIVRASDRAGMAGFTYFSDEYEFLEGIDLIVLDESRIPSHLSLPELLLHEVAHVFRRGETHDWPFLLCLNLLRMECGFGPTMDAYDCSATSRLSPEEASRLLQLGANDARELRQKYDLRAACDLAAQWVGPGGAPMPGLAVQGQE